MLHKAIPVLCLIKEVKYFVDRRHVCKIKKKKNGKEHDADFCLLRDRSSIRENYFLRYPFDRICLQTALSVRPRRCI